MLNYKYRRCHCMNNNYSTSMKNSDIIETSCNNTCTNEKYNSDCSCGFDDEYQDVFPSNPMLGQSYVPIQFINDTLKPCAGLENGTIFPELISPYNPLDGMKEDAYIRATNYPKEGCNS